MKKNHIHMPFENSSQNEALSPQSHSYGIGFKQDLLIYWILFFNEFICTS
jgi:hypothetical protein